LFNVNECRFGNDLEINVSSPKGVLIPSNFRLLMEGNVCITLGPKSKAVDLIHTFSSVGGQDLNKWYRSRVGYLVVPTGASESITGISNILEYE
jgi:hypothetical protein